MSLVATRLSLTHRCVIQRDANASTDDGWGNPEPPDFQAHLTDIPCRVWASTGREVIANETTLTPIEDLRMIVPPSTDVTTSDRIASVSYRGDTVVAGPLGIRAVLPRKDHLELLLTRIA